MPFTPHWQRVFIALSVVLVMSTVANADLYNIGPEQVFDSASHQEYRKELLRIQNSGNACRIQMDLDNPGVITQKVAIEKLSFNAISIIYKMHNQLQNDRTFRHHIGGLLELDLEDIKNDAVVATEVGGLGLYSDGTIELLPIPSGGRLELQADQNRLDFSVPVYKKNNNNYSLPAWAREEIPHIFGFHLHATDTSNIGDRQCGPSFGIDASGYGGDIGYAVYLIKKQNFSHEFVLTKLKGREFSVVYFGGEKLTDNSWFVSVVSLPNFEY